MKPAVFLDRDGVIIANRHDHVKSWAEVELIPGSVEALVRLTEHGLALVIVTNQAAVGRGILGHQEALDLQGRIVREIRARGAKIAGSYLCPHRPEAGCDCRKPAPGMLLRASRELDLELGRSWIVGDAVSDLEAGRAAGVRGILVRTGRGEDQERQFGELLTGQWPVVADLAAAARLVVSGGKDNRHFLPDADGQLVLGGRR
jgi:D-glycero-D-manno-heptose 1,7-bisphosphate phosphatase